MSDKNQKKDESPSDNNTAMDHCTITETAEQTRPEASEPCDDGREG